MFEYYQLQSILRAVDRIPREVTICAAAYLLITDIHKRHANVQLERIKSQAKVHAIELEVEKLRLQLKLRETPPTNDNL